MISGQFVIDIAAQTKLAYYLLVVIYFGLWADTEQDHAFNATSELQVHDDSLGIVGRGCSPF